MFHYTSDSSDSLLYGKHVWEDEIFKWTKEVRRAYLSNSPLNQKYVPISFGKEDIIEARVTKWILDQIADPDSYSQRKRKLSETVGYDESPMTATFEVECENGLNDIVDHEIGLKDRLTFKGFRAFDQRFNLPTELLANRIDEGTFKVETDPRNVWLVLRAKSGHELACKAEAKVPVSIGPSAEEYKIRVLNGPCEVLVSPNVKKFEVKITFDSGTPYTIAELACYFFIISQSDLTISIDVEHGTLASGKADGSTLHKAWVDQCAASINTFYHIIGEEKANTIKANLFEAAEINRSLATLSQLLQTNRIKFTGSFVEQVPRFIAVLFYHVGAFQDYAFGLIIELRCEETFRTDESTSFVFSKPSILQSFCFRTTLEVIKDRTVKAFHDVKGKRSEPYAIFSSGDMLEWLDLYHAMESFRSKLRKVANRSNTSVHAAWIPILTLLTLLAALAFALSQIVSGSKRRVRVHSHRYIGRLVRLNAYPT